MQTGIYLIQAKNGKVIDLYANKMENGSNINLWTNNKGISQKFMLVKLGNFYRFLLACNQTKAIDGGGSNNNVQIYDFDINNKNQMWDIKSNQEQKDSYTLVCQGNNKAMEVDKNQNKDGANIIVNTINNSEGQLFSFINVGKEKPIKNKQPPKQETQPIAPIQPTQPNKSQNTPAPSQPKKGNNFFGLLVNKPITTTNPYLPFAPGNTGMTLAQKLTGVGQFFKGVIQ